MHSISEWAKKKKAKINLAITQQEKKKFWMEKFARGIIDRMVDDASIFFCFYLVWIENFIKSK